MCSNALAAESSANSKHPNKSAGSKTSSSSKASAVSTSSSTSDWTAAKGWNGLVVGQSTLAQTKARLGKVFSTELVSGRKCYNFKDAQVNVFFEGKGKVIDGIWVSGKLNDPAVPKTIKEAEKIFGPLANTGPSGSGGDFYEKPGVKILSNPQGPPDGIAWMEFIEPPRK